jgi:hypothetical protein
MLREGLDRTKQSPTELRIASGEKTLHWRTAQATRNDKVFQLLNTKPLLVVVPLFMARS